MNKEQKTLLRKALYECSTCFHNRISGQGFTVFVCELCHTSVQYPNTSIPRFCQYCCEKHNICQRCGKRMD